MVAADPRPLRLPRLDLTASACLSLSLHVHIPRGFQDKQLSRLYGAEGVFVLGSYPVAGGRHGLLVHADPPSGSRSYALDVEYRGPMPETSGRLITADAFFRKLVLAGVNGTVTTTAVFSYSPGTVSSIISLPMSWPLAPASKLPFDEIVGVRAIKRNMDGGTEYSVVVDQDIGGLISHSVSFNTKQELDAAWIDRSLSAAKQISNLFLSQEVPS